MQKNATALQSRKWLFKSFLRLLTEKPYKTITVQEICKSTDLDRRTFYRHFHSKDNLLFEYMTSLADCLVKDLLEKPTLSNHDVILIEFEFWQKQLPFLHALQRDGLFDFCFNQLDSYFDKHINRNAPAERGEEISLEEIENYQNIFYGAAMNQIMIKWFFDGAKRSPKEMADMFFNPKNGVALESFSDKERIKRSFTKQD
jgi:AcrR family transcriptional regulator